MIDVAGHLERRGIEHKRVGERLMVVCPFHDDHNPSCGVWESSGFFKCFACGEEGSFADFISEVDGVSLIDAKRAIRSSEDLSNLESQVAKAILDDDVSIRFFNVDSFHKVFPAVQGTPGYEYLTERRGLRPEIIERFDVRWGDHGKFTNRVIIPIYTQDGRLLAYTGRGVRDGMIPKTMKNRSPARALYGLRELGVTTGWVRGYMVVVEGEFDVMYLQGLGIPAVANMGTAPMNGHRILLLRRHASGVVLSYDEDEAGKRALYGDGKRRGTVETLGGHLPTFVVHLPEGRDADQLSEDEVEDLYGRFRR